jgi:hypothetical protein
MGKMMITGSGLTKTATGDGIFLSKLVITLSQFFIAQNLIGFADLPQSRRQLDMGGSCKASM